MSKASSIKKIIQDKKRVTVKRVEFHPGMKFHLKENLPLSMKIYKIYHFFSITENRRVSGKLLPGKFPFIKLPPGIFPPMFLNIPSQIFKKFCFHCCHRHHWYYLKDCFVILCFKSAKVRNSGVDVSKKL